MSTRSCVRLGMLATSNWYVFEKGYRFNYESSWFNVFKWVHVWLLCRSNKTRPVHAVQSLSSVFRVATTYEHFVFPWWPNITHNPTWSAYSKRK